MDRKKIIDKVLEAARAKITPVVGGLLGTQLKTASAANRLVSKAEVFEIVNKSVFATLEVEGELQGAAYLVVSIKDAILYGGTLIMLPEAELEGRMKDEDFGADEADAFGEIANIISGIYSATFEEMYPQKIRFVKKDLKVVVPTKVDIDSPDPIPNQMYYMASALVELDSKPVDEIRLLFPAELFGIEIDGKGAAQPDAPSAAQKPASDVRQPASNVGSVPSDAGQSVMKETGPELDPDWTSPAGTGSVEEVVAAPAGPDVEMGGPGSQVLVIAEDPSSGQVFSETIRECGYSVQLLGFNDKIKDAAAAGGVSAVFLIMEKVNEKGMAAIIKAKSVCGNSSPLIAAGPQWTRRTVLQAVKYGARDIVVTPTVPAEVRQKVETHLEASNPGCLVPTDQRSQTEYSSF